MARKPSATQAAEAVTNDFGNPDHEFASRAIRIDHLADLEGKQVIAVIMSSETAPEAALSLKNYHGLSISVSDAITLAKATEVACAVVLHVNDRMSYIIVDSAAWDEVKADPERGNGTDMGTVGVFTMIANELTRSAKSAGFPKEQLLAWASE